MLPVRAEIQTQYFCFVPSRQLFYSLQLRDPPVLPLVTNILKDPVAPEGGFDESAINGHKRPQVHARSMEIMESMVPLHPVCILFSRSITLYYSKSKRAVWQAYSNRISWFSCACCTDFAAPFGIRHWDWCPGRCHSDPCGQRHGATHSSSQVPAKAVNHFLKDPEMVQQTCCACAQAFLCVLHTKDIQGK